MPDIERSPYSSRSIAQAVCLLVTICLCRSDFAVSAAESAGAPVDSRVLQDRYNQIANMSQSERERLQRNLTQFQKLSLGEQERYRELNRQIEADRQLFNLMQTYTTWLQTLTPGQREELRQEKDSVRKLLLVRKFKEEQQHQIYGEGNPDDRDSAEGPRPLTAGELSAMIKVMVANLPRDEHDAFAKATSARLYLEICNHSMQHTAGGPSEWPSAELQQKLIDSLKREERRNFIKSHHPHEREVIARMLSSGIWVHAVMESLPKLPSPGDVDRSVNKMSEEERSRLDQLPPHERHREMIRRYFEDRGDANTFRNLNEVRNGLERMMSDLQVSLPPQMRDGFFPHQRGGGRVGPGGGPPPLRGDRPPMGPPPRDGRPNAPRGDLREPPGRPPE